MQVSPSLCTVVIVLSENFQGDVADILSGKAEHSSCAPSSPAFTSAFTVHYEDSTFSVALTTTKDLVKTFDPFLNGDDFSNHADLEATLCQVVNAFPLLGASYLHELQQVIVYGSLIVSDSKYVSRYPPGLKEHIQSSLPPPPKLADAREFLWRRGNDAFLSDIYVKLRKYMLKVQVFISALH